MGGKKGNICNTLNNKDKFFLKIQCVVSGRLGKKKGLETILFPVSFHPRKPTFILLKIKRRIQADRFLLANSTPRFEQWNVFLKGLRTLKSWFAAFCRHISRCRTYWEWYIHQHYNEISCFCYLSLYDPKVIFCSNSFPLLFSRRCVKSFTDSLTHGLTQECYSWFQVRLSLRSWKTIHLSVTSPLNKT